MRNRVYIFLGYGLVTIWLLALSASAQSNQNYYSVSIQPGYNLIANQLDHGSNTLNEILPNVPEGSVLYKYVNSSGTWSNAFYSVAFGGWTDGGLTLTPGEGAFLVSPSNFTLSFTGTPNVPVLPVTMPAGACYLLSRQTNDIGNYTNIVGVSPVKGSRQYSWSTTVGSYNVATYNASVGSWSSGGATGPITPVGNSVWISPSGGSGPEAFPSNYVIYDNLPHQSLGAAALSLATGFNGVVITNLGSSGQDGVSIMLPTNFTRFEVDYQALDDSGTLPIGAYVQSQVVGAGSTGSSVLATETVTKAGTSNYIISADYSALGVSTYTVQAFFHGILQAQVSGQPGSSLATANILPRGKDLGDIITPLSDEWGGQVAALTIGPGTSVQCDHLLISPENMSFGVVPTAFQIVASQIPSITITGENESLVYQGLTNTSLGNATLAVSGRRLPVRNLGSSGQDGVAIAIPGDYGTNLTRLTVAYDSVDPSNACPTGSFVQGQIVGTGNGITNGVLATLTVTKECAVCGGSNWLVSANYSAVGVSNFTAQAYLQGVLVAQASNLPAASLAVVENPPNGNDVGDYTLPESLEWPGTNVSLILNGGASVLCDHLVIIPQSLTDTIVQRSFQIVCAGVPNLNITSENVSFVYQGLTNTSVGHASLAVSDGQLAVSNLGSSGQDGVSVAWPANMVGIALSCPPSSGTNTLVNGAYFQDQLIGTANGITNGILGTVTVTQLASTNYSVSADYSALGASTYTVQAFFNGVVVGQASHLSGSPLAVANCGPGTLDLIIASASSLHWPTNALLTFGGIAGVLCDHIEITPENVSFPNPPTAFQVVASQVPGFTIATETASFVYQGLTNTSVGHASVTDGGGNLVVSNLGSSGQDGVAITLPGGLTTLDAVWEPFDESNTVPVGAYIQEQIVGTAGTITNGVLGTVTMTKQCAVCGGSNYVISADFSAIGATTYTVQAFSGGTMVAQATGQSGASLASAPYWGDSGCIPRPPIRGGGWDWTNVFLSIGGASVQCDHLFILPEGVTSSSASTVLQIAASEIPSITFSGESATFSSFVYQGLTNTSLGNAILATAGNDLVVSNLGSSGQDGVAVALMPGYSFAGNWAPLDPDDALPIGAYVQTELIGTAGGIANGLLGSTTCTKAGTSNYNITVDYSPLGSFTHTIQVYNGNILVAQVTGQSGSLVATTKLPPGTCTINPMLNQEWPTPTYIAINGGPAVMGTEILMIPEGATEISSVSAGQILAANIPSITITSEVETPGESVNLLYQGLSNTGLGYATMVLWPAVSTNELVLSNLGSSGQDGVTIAFPTNLTALTVEWLPLDPGNALPVGAYVQERILGTANGTANTVLGTITVRKAGTGNYPIAADFSNIGASSYTAQAYLHGIMVAQATNLSGASLALASSWPYSADSEGGIPICTGSVDWGTNQTTVFLGTSAAITCDQLFIIPENVSLSSAPTALQLAASQVPGMTIASENESFVYQGLTNTSLGAAALAVSGSQLVVSNLGSSGQDGVSIAVAGDTGTNLTKLTVACQELDVSNSLPVGAYVRSQMIGTGNGITNGVLGTATVTKECAVCGGSNYLVSADFSPIGATTYTVQAYLNGRLVAETTGSGSALAYCGIFPLKFDTERCDECPQGSMLTVGWIYGTPVALAAGITVTCDHLFISPENVALSPPTGFQITASRVPALTVTSENAGFVYQGLTNTSLGSAALTISGSQLQVSNLGSSGQDGVSISLPSNLTGLVMSCPPSDGTNNLPSGAYFQSQLVGTGNGLNNAVLGTLTVTKESNTNYQVTADYSPIGASSRTVQAFLNGVLVAQVTGQTGPVVASASASPDTFDLGGIEPGSVGWKYTNFNLLTIAGGPTVQCNHLIVSPENVTVALTPAAFQIVASQVSMFTLDTENESLVYQGLTNTSVGHASLTVSDSELVVSNLGSSGQDGVSIAMPGDTGTNLTRLAVTYLPLDISNTLPVGASLQMSDIGTGGSVSNGVLGSVTVTKVGTANYAVTANYPSSATDTFTVSVYNGTNLVASVAGVSGTLCTSSQMGQDTEDPENETPGSARRTYPPGTTFALTGGPTVTGDALSVAPSDLLSTVFSVSSVQLLASSIPSIVITSESGTQAGSANFVYQGLTNTSVGHATVAVSGSQLVVGNLGSSGQDGVAIALPANLTGLDVNWLPLDSPVAPPVGSYIREQIIGTAGPVTNGLLGTITMSKPCPGCDPYPPLPTTNYVVSADFSPIGASTFTVQAFQKGVLVAQATGQSGAILAYCSYWGDSGCIPQRPILGGGWDWTNIDGSLTIVGGAAVACDHLYILPENVSGTPTTLEITASQIPNITILSEQESFVYQGLTNTSLGHASLAASGSQLVVSNLSSSGQDGLSIAWPSNLSALDVHFENLDPSNALAVGAYFTETAVGTANGITNGTLGSITVRKAGATNFAVTADFTPLGTSNCVVQAYLGGQLVGQVTNSGGPDGIIILWPFGPLSVDLETFLEVRGPSLTLDAGFPLPLLISGLATVTCDKVFINPIPPGHPPPYRPTAFQLTASQIPAITIDSENASFVYQGITNTSLGHASLTLAGNQMQVSNIGSSGQDGVSVALPSDAVGVQLSCPPSDGTNVPPLGAYFQSQVVGTASGILNGVLGTARVTVTGPTNVSISADFSPVGTSNFTVEAYLSGVLVGRRIHQPGLSLGVAGCDPDALDLIIPDLSVHFPSNAQWTFNGGTSVLCDHIEILPENFTFPSPPTAFQVVASQVPAFTIARENESVMYNGLTNTTLGSAAEIFWGFRVSSNQLFLSNLGSSGQDGVSIALNPGDNFAGTWLSLDPGNALPQGAYVQSQMIGIAGGVTNGVLGSTRCTKVATSNYNITVDYSPLGSSTRTVQVYNGTTLVAQVTGQTGSLVATTKLPPGTCTINPWLNMDWPSPVNITISGGPTVTGTELLMIAERGAPVSSITAAQILTANIATLTLTNESVSVNYVGTTPIALGNATLSLSGTQLTIGNIGSSGQDGVSFALPGNLSLDMQWQPFDPSNTLPVGAYIQEHLIGTANGVANSQVGTVTMTKLCGTCSPTGSSNFVISADFSPAGASTYTVQAYSNGVLVAQATGQSGAALAYCSSWADSGHLPPRQPPPFEGGWDWPPNGGLVSIAGAANVVCDHLEVIPQNVSGTPTAFQITASQVPALTMTAVGVSPLLISVSQSSQNLTLQWLGTGILQQSSDLKTWIDITNSVSPYVIPAGSSSRNFYRVKQPAGN